MYKEKNYNIIHGICQNEDYPEHNGKPCECANCHHVDDVCVDHLYGSGCFDCDGPVIDCDLVNYD